MKAKFIRKANGWLVTTPTVTTKGKKGQEFKWYATLEEVK